MEDSFFLYFGRDTIQIPLEIALEGSTLREYFEDLNDNKFTIPTDLNFTFEDLVLFFEKVVEEEQLILEESLSLEELLGITTVADFLGYDHLIELLVIQIVKILILKELPEGIFNLTSQTIKTLIWEKLNQSQIFYLDFEKFSSEYIVKMPIVTNDVKENFRPGIAGFVEYLVFGRSSIYTDLKAPPLEREYPVDPFLNITNNRLITDDEMHKTSYGIFQWLSYYDDKPYSTEYKISKPGISVLSKCLLINLIPECQYRKLSTYYNAISVLKYSPYLVGELLIKESQYKGLLNEQKESNWQIIDDEDDIYYNLTIQDKIVNIVDIFNKRKIFYLYLTSRDSYKIDNQSNYFLVYRSFRRWVELYDISKKVRLFKRKMVLPQGVNSRDFNVGIFLDVHNKYVMIFSTGEDFYFNYDVVNFRGGTIPSIPEANLWWYPTFALKELHLVILPGTNLDNHIPSPPSELIIDEDQYGLFTRDPLTLELKELIFVADTEIRGDDIAISPNGLNFTLSYKNVVYYFHLVTNQKKVKINTLLGFKN